MNKITTTEKIVLAFVRVLFSAVFIFSGFVKAIDPLGTAYKFQEYFEHFGGIFEHFTNFALVAAIALIVLEFVIGLFLLFKIGIKTVSWFGLLFMCVMTPLTLYIMLANPVSDCGCFGDALIISNAATFWKNVVLIIFAIYMVIRRKYIRPLFVPRVEAVTGLFFVLLATGFCLYNYLHLPMIDFRPYKTGTNIIEAMQIPEDAPHDVYKTTFIYEKNGVKKEFTLENYPKNDSTWLFVEQKTVLISKGEEPKIHDFSIIDAENGDIIEEVLAFDGYTYLIAMYDLKKTSKAGAIKAEKLYRIATDRGYQFYVLTASSEEEIAQFIQKTGVTFPFYTTDPTALKTMIRSNPGFVLVKNGVITGKWHWREFRK